MNILKKETTTATLKMIALVSMLIDHIGAIIIHPLLTTYESFIDPSLYSVLWVILVAVRGTIGRLALPLFLFMMVEGFFYTHDRKKYLLRLIIFAIISEPLYNTAFDNNILGIDGLRFWHPEAQNIFFDLSMGFITIWCLHTILDKLQEKGLSIMDIRQKGKRAQALWPILTTIAITAIGIVAVRFTRCSYGDACLLGFVAGYLFRRYNDSHKYLFVATVIAVSVRLLVTIVALILYPVMANYNGNQGRKMNKYFFYVFYPAHIAILYLIRLGISLFTP